MTVNIYGKLVEAMMVSYKLYISYLLMKLKVC